MGALTVAASAALLGARLGDGDPLEDMIRLGCKACHHHPPAVASPPKGKACLRARPRAPAWNSGIEWHMYLRIPIEIRDAALNPGWDPGSRTGSQLMPCRPHGVPDYVRRSRVPH